jgi:hypothetical protein
MSCIALRRSRPQTARSIPRSINQAIAVTIETLEGRTFLSSTPLSVPIGGAAAKAVQFTDPNGIKATIQVVGPGNALVTFDGDNLTQGVGAAGVVVSGTGVTLGSVAVTGSSFNTSLQITTRGRGAITAGAITCDGAIAAITAPGVILTGNLTTAAWARQITLGGAQNGTITIGPAHINVGVALRIGSAVDENLNSSIRIDALICGQWLNTDGTTEAIQGTQLVAANITGNFAPDLSMGGIGASSLALGSFRAGAIVGGTWTVSGNVQGILAGSIAPGWSANVNGKIAQFTVQHDATVDLTALMIGNATIRGSLSNSTIALNEPLQAVGDNLNTFSAGSIVSSMIRSIGSIGSITATRLQDSQIYAGLVTLPSGQGLPTSAMDFANVAMINSVSLRRSASASFTGSDIAAYGLGTINLGSVATTNAGTPFGLAAHNIKQVILVDQTTRKAVSQANVPNTTAFSNLLAQKGINQGDFVVSVI